MYDQRISGAFILSFLYFGVAVLQDLRGCNQKSSKRVSATMPKSQIPPSATDFNQLL
jgi:hypothetical protein